MKKRRKSYLIYIGNKKDNKLRASFKKTAKEVSSAVLKDKSDLRGYCTRNLKLA